MKSAEQMRRLEIKRLEQKRWLIKFILYIITVLTILTLLYFNAKLNNQPIKTNGHVINYTVKQGDTLTKIANKYSDEYLPKAICSIKKLNNMTESDLAVGQVLRIEVK